MMSLFSWSLKIANSLISASFILEDISIRQSHHAHHTFEINIALPTDQAFGVNDLKKWLGEKVEITWAKDGEENRFVGMTDSASPYFVRGNRMLRLEGFSPSILMDSGPRFRVFSEMSLEEVVSKVTDEYSGMQFEVEAEGEVQFAVQCQESDFRFLNRMADKYGVNFFYDGEVFHFKDFKESNGKITEITPNELLSLEASINLSPLDFEVRGYNLKNNSIAKADPSEKDYESNEPLVTAAVEKSDKYPKVKFGINYPIENSNHLKSVAKQLATRQTNDLVTLRGRTSDLKLDIGGTIKIQQKDEGILPGVDSSSPFLITGISHSISEDNRYQNSFSAIPADYPFSVNVPSTKNPICGPLPAKVKENNDPDNLGRVRVQFLHDENEALTPWIRVLTNHTAFGGTFWLPEVGETVMVFFEDFNPENAAFVMGSFYNGEISPGERNSKQRGISFENIQMLFNDESGELKIKAKSILLQAEEEIISKASKLTSEAREGITLEGGQSIKQKASRIDLN